MVLYFVVTVLISSVLLFGVQPMIAKSLLPVFGGTSSVWTTCMLFYQTLLLLGYLYAHFVVKRLGWRAQLVVHTGLLAVALGAGIMFDTPSPPDPDSGFPVVHLIGQLALVSGLPFFMIASAGPLVQGWFARASHARSGDPYFLYAASNTGNLIGLLGYPLVIERTMGLDDQRALWLTGFGVFAVLSAGAIWVARKGRVEEAAEDVPEGAGEPISWGRRMRWVFYAFVPSSLLLAVTSHMTMDIASLPLLWVLPLAVYLMTMVAAFGVRDQGKLIKVLPRPVVVAVVASMVLVLAGSVHSYAPIVPLILVDLLMLALVGLLGHAKLAQDRPGAAHLTEFYIVMSVGGALGGLFNSVVAPLIFESTYEFHVVLVLALLLLPWSGALRARGAGARATLRRFAFPLVSLLYVLVVGLFSGPIVRAISGTGLLGGLELTAILLGVILVVPSVLTYAAWKDGLSCALVASIPLLATVIDDMTSPSVLMRERTFYGVHTVSETVINVGEPDAPRFERLRELMHGLTSHGLQFVDSEYTSLPIGYYSPEGPCNAAIRSVHNRHPGGARFGVVGLGTGTIAGLMGPGDTLRYFEIDKTVRDIAVNPEYFTYISGSEADVTVELGDGRLTLEEERLHNAPGYDMLVLDAFSSDAIPVHLLTREAVELYFDRLDRDGVILIHISNRHLDLTGLVFALGQASDSFVLMKSDEAIGTRPFRMISDWMALVRDEDAAQAMLDEGFFQVLEPRVKVRVWTDQYSNMLALLRYLEPDRDD